jgi:hypothetical protein
MVTANQSNQSTHFPFEGDAVKAVSSRRYLPSHRQPEALFEQLLFLNDSTASLNLRDSLEAVVGWSMIKSPSKRPSDMLLMARKAAAPTQKLKVSSPVIFPHFTRSPGSTEETPTFALLDAENSSQLPNLAGGHNKTWVPVRTLELDCPDASIEGTGNIDFSTCRLGLGKVSV